MSTACATPKGANAQTPQPRRFSTVVGHRTDLARFDRLSTVRIDDAALEARARTDWRMISIADLAPTSTSTEFIMFDSVHMRLRGAGARARGVIFSVTHARPHRRRAAAAAATASPVPDSPARSRSASAYVLPPAAAPAASGDYELCKAVLKASTDFRAPHEARWMGRMYHEVIEPGRTPCIAVLLRYASGRSATAAAAAAAAESAPKIAPWLATAFHGEHAAGMPSTHNMHYLIMENADGSNLHKRLRGAAPALDRAATRRCAFQMTHALYQMQRVGGTLHRDLHHGNVMFRVLPGATSPGGGKLPPAYANVLTGDTTDTGEPTYVFYDAFGTAEAATPTATTTTSSPAGATPSLLVKFIDFESATRSTAERILEPSTAICARPPEQLVASMRRVPRDCATTAVHSTAGDTFSLGIMLADMLLAAYSPHARPLWGGWSVAIMRPAERLDAIGAELAAGAGAAGAARIRPGSIVLPGDERYYEQIGAVLEVFSERAQRDERNDVVTAANVTTAAWRRSGGGDPHLLAYVRNMVYLLGAPRVTDLPFVGGTADYLWTSLFAPLAFVCKGRGGRLRRLLGHNHVPPVAAESLVAVLRWAPTERATTFDLLNSAYFARLRVGPTANDGECTTEQFVRHMGFADRPHAIFGDDPSVQSAQALRRRRAHIAATVSTPRRRLVLPDALPPPPGSVPRFVRHQPPPPPPATVSPAAPPPASPPADTPPRQCLGKRATRTPCRAPSLHSTMRKRQCV